MWLCAYIYKYVLISGHFYLFHFFFSLLCIMFFFYLFNCTSTVVNGCCCVVSDDLVSAIHSIGSKAAPKLEAISQIGTESFKFFESFHKKNRSQMIHPGIKPEKMSMLLKRGSFAPNLGRSNSIQRWICRSSRRLDCILGCKWFLLRTECTKHTFYFLVIMQTDEFLFCQLCVCARIFFLVLLMLCCYIFNYECQMSVRNTQCKRKMRKQARGHGRPASQKHLHKQANSECGFVVWASIIKMCAVNSYIICRMRVANLYIYIYTQKASNRGFSTSAIRGERNHE